MSSFAVPAGPPRFAERRQPGHTVGLLLRDEATGGACAFVPGCGGLDDTLLDLLGQAELVLFDGTFWTDDELIALGIGERTAREMDHLPVSGPDGSLERLAALSGRHRIYTHINNTNPMLVEDSPERARWSAAASRSASTACGSPSDADYLVLMTATLASSQLSAPPRPPIPALDAAAVARRSWRARCARSAARTTRSIRFIG